MHSHYTYACILTHSRNTKTHTELKRWCTHMHAPTNSNKHKRTHTQTHVCAAAVYSIYQIIPPVVQERIGLKEDISEVREHDEAVLGVLGCPLLVEVVAKHRSRNSVCVQTCVQTKWEQKKGRERERETERDRERHTERERTSLGSHSWINGRVRNKKTWDTLCPIGKMMKRRNPLNWKFSGARQPEEIRC